MKLSATQNTTSLAKIGYKPVKRQPDSGQTHSNNLSVFAEN